MSRPKPAFPKPFRLRLRDGRIWAGAQFGDGFVLVHHPYERSSVTLATTLDGLLHVEDQQHYLHGARIEWQQEEGA